MTAPAKAAREGFRARARAPLRSRQQNKNETSQWHVQWRPNERAFLFCATFMFLLNTNPPKEPHSEWRPWEMAGLFLFCFW